MKTIVSLSIVSLLVASSLAATCPLGSANQPRLYSDAVGLTAQSNNNVSAAQNLVYNYQFESPFPNVPAVAIGLN